jgi:DNA-binding NtrC family response regulator
LIIDLDPFGLEGPSPVNEFLLLDPDLIIVALADYQAPTEGVQAVKAGAYCWLAKPLDMEELGIVISRGLETRGLRREHRLLAGGSATPLGRFIKKTKAIDNIARQLTRIVNKSQASILFVGETGTGREFLSRWAHSRSNASSGPLAIIPSGQLKPNAFPIQPSLPNRHKLGEFAHPDAFLFKSVERVRPAVQRQLCGFLALRERQGKLPRIMATTSTDLEELADRGRFSRELLYRINTFTFNVPPLRDRKGDIPHLAELFLKSFSTQADQPLKRIERNAQGLLKNYPWPGNISELKRVVERAALLAKDNSITAADINAGLQAKARNCR